MQGILPVEEREGEMGFLNHTCTLCKPSIREDCGTAPGCAQAVLFADLL